MKTTVEIPDAVFRKAKTAAASRGQSLKQFLNHAIEAELGHERQKGGGTPPWMKFVGTLSKAEAKRINAVVEREFEQIDPQDWK